MEEYECSCGTRWESHTGNFCPECGAYKHGPEPDVSAFEKMKRQTRFLAWLKREVEVWEEAEESMTTERGKARVAGRAAEAENILNRIEVDNVYILGGTGESSEED